MEKIFDSSVFKLINENIIKKLNRNEYVIKVDSKDGWIKVKYNLVDGKEIEGWIYQTMLSKIN